MSFRLLNDFIFAENLPNLFRQTTALLLLLAFALQTFSKTVFALDYFVNTTAYAKNCENKAQPQMHCNGKCQMMKMIAQEEKKDQQNPERKAENKNELVLSSKSFYPSLRLSGAVQKHYFLPVASGSVLHMPRALFHPPIC